MAVIELQRRDLEDIIHGAAFFGSGGGGPVTMALKLLPVFEERWFPIALHSAADAADAWRLAMVAGMGSPAQASSQKDAFSHAPQAAVKLLQQQAGVTLDGVVPIEVGPMNSLIPLLVAAQTGLKVVDADGGGRAFSTLSMATFNLEAGVAPYVLCNDATTPAQSVGASLQVGDADMADAISRGIVEETAFQGAGACASYLMSGQQMKRCAVPGGIARALALGRVLRPYRESGRDPVDAVRAFLGPDATLLFSGTLDSVSQSTSDALDFGILQWRADGRGFTAYNLNENLIGWRDDHAAPAVMAPDGICVVLADGSTCTNANIAQLCGKRMHVFGVKAAALTTRARILGAYQSALRRLGYPGPYCPLGDGGPVHGDAAAPYPATVWRRNPVRRAGAAG